ncbi:hypothetical protein ACFW91_24875 [Streptomyces asoensis]|uniref:hypothetical protein n=1 Tax=Streptomyces asoensis TaxID=249586 RepID=UPI0036C6CA31
MPGLTFTLRGDDDLSGTLDGAGDHADRLARRLDAAARSGNASMYGFTRDTQGRLRDLHGRYITTAEAQRLLTASTGDLTTRLRTTAPAARDTSSAMDELGKVTRLLWPAAIPAAASLAPIAVGALTVAAGMAAMGAAIIPQIAALSEVGQAEKAWNDAVDKSGATSAEAAKAQAEYAAKVSKLPPETRKAAAAVGVLKDNYKQFSDGLSGDTMPAFVKGVGILNGLLPRTAGLAKATSVEADRFMTVIGGEMASPGLDRLNGKFTNFATKTLRSVNDEIVHLLRVGESGGGGGGAARDFLEWARAQGPTVASVLRSVAEALVHILDGASGVGVGLLQTVEILARLVSAVPPGAIATFLQLALALKAVKLAALGFAAGRAALVGFVAQLTAMQTAAAAAPGRLAAVRAAVLALSRTTKIAMAGTGIGLAILAITELAQRSSSAPPDVDKLTQSLRVLGTTGKVTGESAKAFGSDLDGLYGKVRSLTDPTTTDKVQQFLVGWTGWDSTPVKDAKGAFDSIDQALANLVKNGDADKAAAALKRYLAAYTKDGHSADQFTKHLGEYKSALADAKFEQGLAADSMGLFGSQAQSVAAKLAAQKVSADGLKQSIQALSETHRNAFDAETKFEAAVDAATKALADNGRTLDKGSEKGRANRDALSQLATATEDAATKARENGASWETVSAIYDKGHKALVDNATAMGGSRTEAERLAATLLTMPSPKMRVEMRTEDAVRGLDSVIAAINKTPNAKSVTVSALTSDALSLLRSLGFTVKKLPDGRFKVTADTATAKASIAAVQRARDGLKDKSISLTARDAASKTAREIAAAIAAIRSKTVTLTTVRQTLGIEGMAGRNNKNLNGFAGGGRPRPGEVAWVGENGPELMSFSGTELIFDHAKSMSMIRPSTEAAGALAGSGLAGGMLGSRVTVGQAARAMAAEVEAGIRDEMEIASPSKKTTALAKDIGKGLIVGMTSTREKIKATAADLAKDIQAAFSGKKETGLLKSVSQQTTKLLAAAAARDKVAAALTAARQFASSTTQAARDNAGLSNLGMDAEQVTAGGIKAGLATKLANLKQFTNYINILAKKGLSKSLLQQILNMGPEQGFAYASALVGADKGTFNSINSLQTQLRSSSDVLGRTGADAMYDSGRNAAKGFLTGLSSQQAALQKTMETLAKAMQKALRKALGISSPARKVIPDGINTARGVAVGVLAGLPYVDRAMDTLSGRITGRAAIAPVAGRAAVLGGPVQQVMQVQVDVHDAMDPVAVGRELQRVLLELGRVQGSTVQLKIGG